MINTQPLRRSVSRQHCSGVAEIGNVDLLVLAGGVLLDDRYADAGSLVLVLHLTQLRIRAFQRLNDQTLDVRTVLWVEEHELFGDFVFAELDGLRTPMSVQDSLEQYSLLRVV